MIKDILKIGQKKFLSLKIRKIKITVPWTYINSDLNGEGLTGTFYEKELQKTSQEKSRTEKVIKRKGGKLYVKWKGYDNTFNSWINKKTLNEFLLYKNESNIPKPFKIFGGITDVKVDISN